MEYEAEMMADLGATRRDVVSAPMVDNRGRAMRVDYQAVHESHADYAARQKRYNSSLADGHASSVREWNTPSTFEIDESATHLENFSNGQLHRKGLVDKMKENPQFDRPSHGSVRQPNGQHYGGRNQHNAANYRNLLLNRDDSGRIGFPRQSSQPLNPSRAPDPRLSGTTRYDNGVRTQTGPPIRAGGRGAMPQAPPAPAPSRTNAPPSAGPQNSASSSGTARPPSQASLNRVNARETAPRSLTPSIASTNGVKSRGKASSASSVTSTAAPAVKTLTELAASLGHRMVDYKVYWDLATFYAATGGKEADRYHLRFPDRVEYLEHAKRWLIKQAINVAKDPVVHKPEGFLSGHAERGWFLKAAINAKDMYENHSNAESAAYYEANESECPFLAEAAEVFTRRVTSPVHKENVAPAKASPAKAKPTKAAPAKAAPAKEVQLSNGKEHAAPAVAPKTPTVGKPRLNGSAHPNTISSASTNTPSQSKTVINSGMTPRADGETASTSKPKPSPPAVAATPANVAPLRADSVMNMPAKVAPSSSGSLTASIYNAAGQLVGKREMVIDAPVTARMNVLSREANYDPRHLSGAIEKMVDYMNAKSNGVDANGSNA